MKQELKIKKIKDQVIVITGASSGIGLATAKMAAKKGAKVVLSSRNTRDLKNVVADIQEQGGTAIAIPADVSKWADMESLKDRALAHFGHIDTWVNNAGTGIFGEVVDTPIDEARALFDTNFWGIHYGCMAALGALRESGGVIINLGSEVSERAVNLQTFYAASKHAIKGYTEGLRNEIEAKGLPVKFTLIRPAAIDTPFTEHAPNHLREGEPSLPPPVYHPDVVASAIIEAAQTGKRDVYIGGTSKLVSTLEHLAPALMDLLVSAQADKQKEGADVPHTAENEGLLSRPAHEGKVRGGHKGHVMKTSLWTSASLHPFATTLMLLGFGTVVVSLLSGSEKKQVSKPSFFDRAKQQDDFAAHRSQL